jgi:hypothetical protein
LLAILSGLVDLSRLVALDCSQLITRVDEIRPLTVISSNDEGWKMVKIIQMFSSFLTHLHSHSLGENDEKKIRRWKVRSFFLAIFKFDLS